MPLRSLHIFQQPTDRGFFYWFRITIFLSLIFAVGSLVAGITTHAFSYESRVQRDAYAIGERCGHKSTIAYEMFGLCLGEELVTLSQQHNLSRVSDTLVALQYVDERARDCHLAGHLVTEKYTRNHPGDWERILSQVDHNACLGGFFHGVLEGYLDTTQSTIDAPFITKLCDAIDTTAYGEGSCGHILGHAVLVQAQGDIEAAVRVCDRVPQYLQPLNCYIGVFMEHTTKVSLIDHGLAEAPHPATKEGLDELQRLCESFASEYPSRACWGEVARIAMEYTGRDLVASVRECQRASRPASQNDCAFFSAFGKILWEGPTVAATNNACAAIASFTAGPWCASGIAQSLLYASSQNAPISISICSSQGISRQDGCFAQIGAALVTMVSEQQRFDLCNENATGEALDICLNRLFVNG